MSASDGTTSASSASEGTSGNSSLGTSALNAATSIGQATADTLRATGNIASSAAKTGADVVKNLGNVATSGTQILSTTIGAIATTTERIENSTKEMATRRAEIERSKTAAQQGKTAAEIAQIEADTNIKLQEIESAYQISKKIEEDKLAKEMASLNSSETQRLLTDRDNTNKKSTSYYYGFTNSNPKPNDIGSVKSFLYNSKWCYSYIPEVFVTKTGTVIEIVLPEKELTSNSKRDPTITAIDNSSGREIYFALVKQTRESKYWDGTPYVTVPVIKYADNPSVNLDGKMYYNKIWFVCDTNGGKKRRTYKRRTNKKQRTYKKQRTNKRRTYKKNNKR